MSIQKVLLLNGPNLNLLGLREPEIYGSTTLKQIEDQLIEKAKAFQIELSCYQSNSEYELIGKIHSQFEENYSYAIINPGAFTHTSIALRDSLLAVNLPFVEVHLSNIYQREPFRHHSYFSDISSGCIIGMGILGYHLALDFIAQKINQN